MTIPVEKIKFIADNQTSIKGVEKQGGDCYICCSPLEVGNEILIKTDCGHYFHYECLMDTFKFNRHNHKSTPRECPYCRTLVGFMPLIDDYTSEYHIHKEHILKSSFIRKCGAILKSGMKRGQVCNCRVKKSTSDYCGRHKNYKPPPSPKLEVPVIVNDWYKNKTLVTYFH